MEQGRHDVAEGCEDGRTAGRAGRLEQVREPGVVATITNSDRRPTRIACDSLQHALALANRGAESSVLFASAGSHVWEGDLLVQAGSCNVTADEEVRACMCVRVCAYA